MTEKLPEGIRVLVTRPREQGQALCERIAAAGGRPLGLPATEILPPADPDAVGPALAACRAADLVIFVSRNAVRFAARLRSDLPALLAGCTVLAAGEGTAQELSRIGIAARTSAPGGYGSDALLEMTALGEAQIRGKSVLVVRGAGGREHLRRELERRGARVAYVEVYGRSLPRVDMRAQAKLWHDDPPDVIVITSIQGLDHLVEMTPEMYRQTLFATPLAVISPRVRDHAARSGFRAPVAVAPAADDAGLMAAIRAAAMSTVP